jgi:hypothetical protein
MTISIQPLTQLAAGSSPAPSVPLHTKELTSL